MRIIELGSIRPAAISNVLILGAFLLSLLGGSRGQAMAADRFVVLEHWTNFR